MSLEEGERLQLPCRCCASVSLVIPVARGRHEAVCAECGAGSVFEILRSASG